MRRRKLHNIIFVRLRNYRAWRVEITRGGKRYQRHFQVDGDRAAALAEAIRWRDEMLAKLPPPWQQRPGQRRVTKGRRVTIRSPIISPHPVLRRELQHIIRCEHGGWRAWCVELHRQDQCYKKYFRDDGSSSQGRLPSPSSHRTGLVDLTSGSSGRRGSRRSGAFPRIPAAVLPPAAIPTPA